jgi:hypothetical protein
MDTIVIAGTLFVSGLMILLGVLCIIGGVKFRRQGIAHTIVLWSLGAMFTLSMLLFVFAK